MVMTGTPVGAAGKDRYTVHSNELMIFIRKRDHKVVNVLVGGPTDERPLNRCRAEVWSESFLAR